MKHLLFITAQLFLFVPGFNFGPNRLTPLSERVVHIPYPQSSVRQYCQTPPNNLKVGPDPTELGTMRS